MAKNATLYFSIAYDGDANKLLIIKNSENSEPLVFELPNGGLPSAKMPRVLEMQKQFADYVHIVFQKEEATGIAQKIKAVYGTEYSSSGEIIISNPEHLLRNYTFNLDLLMVPMSEAEIQYCHSLCRSIQKTVEITLTIDLDAKVATPYPFLKVTQLPASQGLIVFDTKNISTCLVHFPKPTLSLEEFKNTVFETAKKETETIYGLLNSRVLFFLEKNQDFGIVKEFLDPYKAKRKNIRCYSDEFESLDGHKFYLELRVHNGRWKINQFWIGNSNIQQTENCYHEFLVYKK